MEFINEQLIQYCQTHSEKESELLQSLSRDTYAKVLNPRMLSGHLQGRFLSTISRLVQPKYILEIGTYTGYSALCLSEGLQKGGKLITIDINDELEIFTKKYIDEAGQSENILQKTGDALQIIPTLDFTFDLVFIDADKLEYYQYFQLIIDKVRPGGIILADNVLWSGHVLEPLDQQDKETKALSDFNKKIAEDSRVHVFMLPLRDGISMIQKKI